MNLASRVVHNPKKIDFTFPRCHFYCLQNFCGHVSHNNPRSTTLGIHISNLIATSEVSYMNPCRTDPSVQTPLSLALNLTWFKQGTWRGNFGVIFSLRPQRVVCISHFPNEMDIVVIVSVSVADQVNSVSCGSFHQITKKSVCLCILILTPHQK